MFETYHIPVLLNEVIDGLLPAIERGRANGESVTVVDATAGGFGHSSAIAKKLLKGDKIVCIDKDLDAFKNKDKVSGCETVFVHNGFENIIQILKDNNIEKVDAILADLGVSSHQIDTAERGFSYTKDGALDMRMNQDSQRDAWHVVNHYTPARLEQIIKEFGEERYARQIASAIVAARPIDTTGDLTKVITGAVPSSYYKTGGHPAKRTFQAIRMEVNRELEVLEKFVYDAVKVLKKGGRIAIITFHSLEDRIVKHAFKYLEAECVCPPKTPKCICGKTRDIEIITKKPIVATAAEQKENSRSTSAKLRIGEKAA